MKKWIVLAVVLVLVVGGGVATILGLKGKDTDDTSASTEVPTEETETVVPYILAKEKLVLTEDGSANTNACAFNIENATIKYLSSDTNIAEVDSFGNVFAIKEGSTFVRNYFVLNNVEYSYKTNIIVLPKDIESTLVLLDEDNKESTEINVGEKYTLKLTTNVDLKYYDITLVASDGAKTTGTNEKQEKTFSCEIYFETQYVEMLGLKLTLNADCGTREYMTQTLSFLDTKEEQATQENPIKTESEDTNNDKSSQTEQETDDQETTAETPTQDTDSNRSKDENNQEEVQEPTTSTDDDNKSDNQENVEDNEDENNSETSLTPTQTPQQEKLQAFSLSSGTNKNVEISDSVITISNFTKPTDIALSLKVNDTQNKHKLQLEILSGDNITFDLSTSMLGLAISSTGSTTFRLSSLTDPSIYQIFTIIVE